MRLCGWQGPFQAGLFQIEITFRSAVAPDALRQVVRKFPGMTVGAGTLLCPDQVLQAFDACAPFGVRARIRR